MGKKIISGSTYLPNIGQVQWTASETRTASGSVFATVLQEAIGPTGRLSDDDRELLVRVDHRLTA